MAQDNGTTKHPRRRKFWITSIIVIIAGLALFAGIRFYYPFGEGVKTGQLNFVVYKGVVFKTYEGRLIQSGFQTNKDGGIQSNEFNFSVADKKIAEKLMKAGGQTVELHYKEYFGALPWRGYSKYIVDEIISMTPAAPQEAFPLINPQ